MTSQAARAAEIEAHFRRVADDDLEAEAVFEALARAFAAILAHHGQGELAWSSRERIVRALFAAEATAEQLLPPWYWHERGKHGFTGAFGLVAAWAEPLDSPKRTELVPSRGVELTVRIVANDLDSLAAAYACQRLGSAFPPMSVLMPAQRVTAH